jgi:catechol 2,3-dioxygenase-like lactoylglutathione lyase family enzyme
MPAPTIAELVVGDEPAAWAQLGFAVDGDRTTVGATTIVLDGSGGGLRSWALRDAPTTAFDGLETATASSAGDEDGRAEHPNGAVRIDHVVVNTPDLQRTFAALRDGGLDLRRVREHSDTLHQGFFRLGEVILEVVGPPQPAGDGPARFWGLVAVVPDVDALAAETAPGLFGEPRAAVQAGRRIVTVRSEAGLSVALAFLTP